VLVPPNHVILLLVATNLLFLAMIMMHVLLTDATLTLDVPTPRLTAMITMLVLPIAVILPLDATTNQ
jgi:hypothetical protein